MSSGTGPNRTALSGDQIIGPLMTRFTPADAAGLLELARTHGATLVTTEKDRARLAGGAGPLADLHAQARALPIRLTFDARDEGRLAALIEGAVGRRGQRR